MTRLRILLIVIGLGAIALVAWVAVNAEELGAAALLHPLRRVATNPPPAGCEEVTFQGAGVNLEGWHFRGAGARRGTLIYLHGVADNRASATGVIERFGRRGFDVVAYNSRAHGKSGGDACTYGFFEKQDLARVLDAIQVRPIVLLGASLGGAVALQEAATDDRVAAVIAAETFSDLRSVVIDRSPRFFSPKVLAQALKIAEEKGRFRIDEVSPEAAAKTITAPVLLIHGEADTDTPPEHTRRVFAALTGPKRLILVPGARHNESLRGDAIWGEIEQWIETALGLAAAPADVPRPPN